ncbi:sigma factor-like helix-turn-helix DNA-binding protein [Streptomyces rhizosphaerihabitans]|uniref:sigma factor-like helix-turn-helix DNA-binding protein n=1 Tax=Streptomyces rhizosphaerihabitans TaxID=1266770 RepID=UPI003703D833
MTAGLEALESYDTLSLDVELTVGDDGYRIGDTLGRPASSFDVVDREPATKPRQLPDRERATFYLRLFEGMTQSRITDRFGISHSKCPGSSRAVALVHAKEALEQ